MIRHIVLIKFQKSTTEQEIAALFEELKAIRAHVDGILSIVCGKSESPEKIERGYLHGFIVDFDAWEALARYQDHPEHKALGAKLIAAAEGGINGILVFDLDTGRAQ